MTRRRRGRRNCCAGPEEIDDDEILRRVNVLYRGASLSQVLGEWKRLKVENEKLLERARPMEKHVSLYQRLGGRNRPAQRPEDYVWCSFAAVVKGDEKAWRGYAFMYGNADDWDVIRDCHEKSMRAGRAALRRGHARAVRLNLRLTHRASSSEITDGARPSPWPRREGHAPHGRDGARSPHGHSIFRYMAQVRG